ncbi:hypothetical protein GQ44DRAFT_725877 [Phaeosphaeriaceae sp. PMI808]|nr:hypothetical protein GQ44DRAFT_725877 [Phaeosphaeriaceae sp. PMI808]
MASQCETSNTAAQDFHEDTPEHPVATTQKHLAKIYQHLQACYSGLNACKSTSERYESAYHREFRKLRDLRKQYDLLAGNNQYYMNLFHQYENVHQEMQKCVHSCEDRVKELERENHEAKKELGIALSRLDRLEGEAVRSSQSLVQKSPITPKRQRPADVNDLDVPLEPEKKRGRARKHLKSKNEAKAEEA